MKIKISKTYLFAFLGIGASIAYSFDLLKDRAFETIIAILGFGSVAALRRGVTKEAKKTRDLQGR